MSLNVTSVAANVDVLTAVDHLNDKFAPRSTVYHPTTVLFAAPASRRRFGWARCDKRVVTSSYVPDTVSSVRSYEPRSNDLPVPPAKKLAFASSHQRAENRSFFDG